MHCLWPMQHENISTKTLIMLKPRIFSPVNLSLSTIYIITYGFVHIPTKFLTHWTISCSKTDVIASVKLTHSCISYSLIDENQSPSMKFCGWKLHLLYCHQQVSCCFTARGEAIMLVNLSIIFFSAVLIILPIMLTDFIYYSQNYAWFNVHDITDN